ncbi:MAG TPA: glycosyltransferase [Bacteroidia bacterium]|nr:glycosyltransferase [Bacteroidia bacterium]
MLFPEFQTLGLPEWLCLTACFAFILILVNYLLNYLPLSRFGNTHLEQAPENPEPLSVIICARNEEDNLREFLPRILNQDYPEYEVVVVNDCSFDNTENVIDEFSAQYPRLRKANIKEDAYYKHGKKFAMLVGIKAARYQKLVFTDADCYPSSDQWLREMRRGFAGEKEIVLGYGAYRKQKGFLNKLIRFDTFMIAVQYLSSAIQHKAYMGVGRNLAYNKDLFFKQKGFSSHYHINSGDDDLFVNKAATASNVNICVVNKAITYSVAKNSFRDWRIQKARHLSTAPLYSPGTKSKLGFIFFSQFFFYASVFALFFSTRTLILIPIFLLLKLSLQWLVLYKASRKLEESDLLAGSLLYELILLLIYPIFHLSKFTLRSRQWTS